MAELQPKITSYNATGEKLQSLDAYILSLNGDISISGEHEMVVQLENNANIIKENAYFFRLKLSDGTKPVPYIRLRDWVVSPDNSYVELYLIGAKDYLSSFDLFPTFDADKEEITYGENNNSNIVNMYSRNIWLMLFMLFDNTKTVVNTRGFFFPYQFEDLRLKGLDVGGNSPTVESFRINSLDSSTLYDAIIDVTESRSTPIVYETDSNFNSDFNIIVKERGEKIPKFSYSNFGEIEKVTVEDIEATIFSATGKTFLGANQSVINYSPTQTLSTIYNIQNIQSSSERQENLNQVVEKARNTPRGQSVIFSSFDDLELNQELTLDGVIIEGGNNVVITDKNVEGKKVNYFTTRTNIPTNPGKPNTPGNRLIFKPLSQANDRLDKTLKPIDGSTLRW